MSGAGRVAVVGAGPVGLFVAALLAQRGVAVDVFEARDEPVAWSRAIGIHPPGLAALARVGLAERVRADGVMLDAGVVSSRGAVLARVEFGARTPVVTLPQARTEALLAERLERLSPGAVHRGVRVSAVDNHTDHVELGFDDGGTHRADYVIAADGVRSGIRSMLGIGWQPQPGLAHYVMADLPAGAASAAHPRTAYLHLEPGGVVESFPLPGGTRRWVALRETDAAGDTPADSPADSLAAIVDERLGVRLDMADARDPRAFVARQHLAMRLVAGRVLLVGDAAHEISPIGGQGMNLGWLDAVALAGVIAEAPDDYPAAGLARYDRTRRRAAFATTRRARFNMAMGSPMGRARAEARDAAVRLLSTRPLRGAITGAVTMRGL